MRGFIKIRGAQHNNLKGLDCDIPLNQITVITGVSGSGKSSLAFDTLYAEGQRRYIETFSPYARQFMERMDKAKVKAIEGIPPAIAVEQGNPVRTSRSTVGTITELTDFIKLLFSRIGNLHCRGCSRKVLRDTPDTIWRVLAKNRNGTGMIVAFPFPRGDIDPKLMRAELLHLGFTRILKDKEILDIEEGVPETSPVYVVVDRVIFNAQDRERIIDSIEQGLRYGNGHLIVKIGNNEVLRFSSLLHCPYCDIYYKNPVPNLFSFNSPIGACDVCKGFGRIIDIDMEQVIPNPDLSLEMGAIKVWDIDSYEYRDLMRFCKKTGIPTAIPFRVLHPEHQKMIRDGTKGYYGIRGFFKWLEAKAYKMHVRVFLSRYRGYYTCQACKGTRFKSESLLYRIRGCNISEIYSLSIGRAYGFFKGIGNLSIDQTYGKRVHIKKPEGLDNASGIILKEVTNRLHYLKEAGLSYLTLDRQSRTLSGGEVERVSLTRALGSSLVDTLYVLDEPSVGLHARDSKRLVEILKILSQENTVVVVEHDPEIISGCDNLLDLGPGAGEHGGSIVYSGPISNISNIRSSITIDYLTGRSSIPVPKSRKKPMEGRNISITGCREHNLKDIKVRIPLGLMICLTGVSGSGKSSLAQDIIFKGISRTKGFSYERPGAYDEISGEDMIDGIALVDQSPIGRTPRSNPLSYIGALSPIRSILANTPLAMERGYKPGMFSFNVRDGQCRVCGGNGYEKVEMQFLSDVYVTCPECKGTRFKKEVLDVTYKRKSIGAILDMTFSEAGRFFHDSPKIVRSFRPLIDVGLGYLRLGQPINTLSGGEAQRLKVASYLNIKNDDHVLYIFDEPTTGLHFTDIQKLLTAFESLRNRGNTLLIIEHNLDVIKCADYIIDLGPEGGDAGGMIVAEGSPEEVAGTDKSYTGRYLKRYLDGIPSIAINPYKNGPADKSSQRGDKDTLEVQNIAGDKALTLQGKNIAGDKAPEYASCYNSAGSRADHEFINIIGAREHNLKNISLKIPRNKMVVITGISGSGKSSLVFDVLFAEGQRRYIESLPTYVRQYLKIMERADVDIISGISPTVAIEQRMSLLHRRSTVATITEIYHYLRLMFSKLGIQYCKCGKPITPQSEDEMLIRLINHFNKREIFLIAPKVIRRKGMHRVIFEDSLKKGYKGARVDGVFMDIGQPIELERYKEHSVDIVTGIVQVKPENYEDIKGSISKALEEGKGLFYAVDKDSEEEESFSTKGYCPECGSTYEDLDPRFFSFNSKYGACPRCDGTGSLSENGPICPACRGERLNERALSVKIAGHTITDMTGMSVDDAGHFFPEIPFSEAEKDIADLIIPQIIMRIDFLNRAGLSYLTLDRSGNTLSGGETQRIRLSAQLGSNLRGVCYILDEPTIGLHPRDNEMLINTLITLKDRGNSVIVVEHDEETIRRADHIIDLGPGAGVHGGRLIAQGTPEAVRGVKESVTAKWLFTKTLRKKITSHTRRAKDNKWLYIKGATVHNLKGIDVKIPIGTLVCITGVSGSGKSSLLMDVIYTGMKSLLNQAVIPRGTCTGIDDGWRNFERVLVVDHSPIGRTPRSTPGTYIGFHDHIRRLFARLPESSIRGYNLGRFSFNVKGGRCEACKGEGRIRVEMSFLPEVYIDCGVCQGKRFDEETLSVVYKGHNIADVLNMTVEEGLGLFRTIPKIAKPLQLLIDLGLGYLQIGQASNTLSGGEAQRIKLAYELNKAMHGKNMYILDEPTTGLHLADIEKLMGVLQRLVDLGNTVLIIEHNLEVVKEADYIIDLGPEGGERGGRIVAEGPPQEILKSTNTSYTAKYLKKYLEI